MIGYRRPLVVLAVFSALLATPLQHAGAQESKAPSGQVQAQTCKDGIRQKVLHEGGQGYLMIMPNSISLLPPAPAPGSAAQAFDEAVHEQKSSLRDTPRWRMATDDADLDFPQAAGRFSCAVGTRITKEETPRLYHLIYRTLDDASAATRAAKECYQRRRPFDVHNEHTCTPKDEDVLKGNGSYPSGHATVGWMWALILSEVAPDRADMILARGLAFGQSRVVCNVHWESDVIAGTLVGAALVARLHTDPTFMADLAGAKAEVAANRAKGIKPLCDCAAEARAYWLDGTDDDITSLKGVGAGPDR